VPHNLDFEEARASLCDLGYGCR